MTGTIKKIIPDKHYGFIRDAHGIEYFFHKDACKILWEDFVSDFHGGMIIEVEFDDFSGARGPRAENVRRVE
jgi:cold shock CspA family protein